MYDLMQKKNEKDKKRRYTWQLNWRMPLRLYIGLHLYGSHVNIILSLTRTMQKILSLTYLLTNSHFLS